MHRSGTSALTRVLGLLGADLPLNLLGANDGNEAGHWESVDLIAVHDNLLSSAGSTWDDWRAFNPDWTASPVADAYKQQIADTIERNWPASPLFVVKDPRICRFVPVWLDVLDRIGVEPRIVIPVRNPLEVAASLKRRNGFLPAKSYLLWLRHVLDAELSTRDLPRAFTTYDHLLTDWRSAVAQVAQKAGICWPRHSDFAELEIDKFLATTLRHHSFDAASLDARSEIVDWVKEAHDILSRMASGDRSRSHLTRLDQIRAEFEKASRVFGLVLAENEEKTAMVAQVHANESKQTHAQLAELEQEVARLREGARHEATTLRNEAEREVAQLRDEAEREAAKLRDEAELARVFAAEQERLATERFIAIEEAGRREALLIRKIETTQTDLLAAVAERNEAQSQLEQSRREAATLRSDRDGARAGMREAQSQLQSLAGDLDVAQTALTQERKSRERALADVTRLAATTDRLNAVEASLRFEKTLARRQADELARLRSALAEAVDAAQEQQHAAQMVLTEERAARELAQADIARLAATVDQLAASEASLKYERSLSGQQKHEIARLQSALAEAETGAAARDAKSGAEAERAAAEVRTLRTQAEDLRATVAKQAAAIEDKAARPHRAFSVWRSMRQRLSRWRRPDFEARAWEVEPIRRSKLFSALWYLEHNPDVAASGDDPLLHYLVHGGMDRRNPHPLFDARWYVAQYPQVAEAKMTPLTHYVTVGVSEGLDPMPLFDTDFYLCQNPDVAAANTNPLYHYWAYGAYEGRDPNPLFDSSWYLEKNPDIAAAKDNPLLHYILHGWKEGRDPHPDFNTQWYLEQNPDVAAAEQNPLEHYVLHGNVEGRSIRESSEPFTELWGKNSPSLACDVADSSARLIAPIFDEALYRYQIEVEQRLSLFESPLHHYLREGYKDDTLLPNILFNPSFYLEKNKLTIDEPALLHYARVGDRLGCATHPHFNASLYNAARTDGNVNVTAIEHFLKAPPEQRHVSHHQMSRPISEDVIDFVQNAVARQNAAFGLMRGAEFNISDLPLGFYADDYRALNPDLAEAFDPDFLPLFAHYLQDGWRENRMVGKWQLYIDLESYCISKPISKLVLPTTEQKGVCVLMHIFYDDLVQELVTYANAFGPDLQDVFINIVDSAWSVELQARIRELCPGAFVMISPNIGRDIGGFLRLLEHIDIAKYEAFAFMHTKKSPHVAPEKADYWRRKLLNAIAGNREIAQRCMKFFREDAGVGLIGSEEWRATDIASNAEKFEEMLNLFGIESQHRNVEYLSGTMFLIRPQIVQRLFDVLKNLELESGDNQTLNFNMDGQLAHAIERVVGNVVRQLGYRMQWVTS